MCQYRFISCNKLTTVVGDVDCGWGHAFQGTGGMWKISVHSSQICCESKTKKSLCAKLLQLYPKTLCDPTGCSGAGSSRLWDSPGKNTWQVGCHALLQEIFPTKGLNLLFLRPLHWQAGSFPLVTPGKPKHSWVNLICLHGFKYCHCIEVSQIHVCLLRFRVNIIGQSVHRLTW